MTSMPASRRARAMILAPRSCPSRPGLATTTRTLRVAPPPLCSRSASACIICSLFGARLGVSGDQAGVSERLLLVGVGDHARELALVHFAAPGDRMADLGAAGAAGA